MRNDMTPELWFEYVAGTILAVGGSLLLLLFIAACLGLEITDTSKRRDKDK